MLGYLFGGITLLGILFVLGVAAACHVGEKLKGPKGQTPAPGASSPPPSHAGNAQSDQGSGGRE